MERLTSNTKLPAQVRTPGYQPHEHGIGMVHFGLGAFSRAHLAVYTDEVMAQLGGDWRISGISLRSSQVHDRLMPQDCRYTLAERAHDNEKLRIIGSVAEVITASKNPAAVFKRLTHPALAIISLTITEKGYLRDPSNGNLLQQHPDILHDLEHPDTPHTVHGFLTEGLKRRQQYGLPPVTLLCCDNLAENGKALKRVLLEFARLREVSLAEWIETNIAFPNTMVDRIVPATAPAQLEQLAQVLGVVDAAPVICEPFRQWVIEEHFSSPRPAWEKFGVTFVKQVAPFEAMKLRLLNGSHSAIAYLGYLGGFEFVHQVISNQDYLRFVEGLMAEIGETLQVPAEVELAKYCQTLLERFRNPVLKHRTGQIAMDGSMKLPQRLLAPLKEQLAAKRKSHHLVMAVAGWMRYVQGMDEQEQPIEISDPYAERFRLIAETCGTEVTRYVQEMLAIEEIFGADLPSNADFRQALLQALERLQRVGAKNAIKTTVNR